MRDGAIVHLTEDSAQKLEVPDDHVVMHVHASSFEKEGHIFWLESKFSDTRGKIFTLKLTRTSSNSVLNSAPQLWEK